MITKEPFGLACSAERRRGEMSAGLRLTLNFAHVSRILYSMGASMTYFFFRHDWSIAESKKIILL